MIPPLIVREAIKHGLNLIAITDHNASHNVPAVIKAAEGKNLTVLPGIELQTKEEVHILCIFDDFDQLTAMQTIVDESLPDMKNNAEFFGEQFIVDDTGDFIQREERLLITSTSLSFDQAFQAVTSLGGLFIPAHVNRKGFGLIYHLGFIPPGIAIDALEISRHITIETAIKEFPQIKGYPLIQSGDVHYLEDFLGVNKFILEQPTVSEIRMALKGQNGRSLEVIRQN